MRIFYTGRIGVIIAASWTKWPTSADVLRREE
jgi:hypothetical protein